MKYEIIKHSMDNYTLKYKDQEIKFNSKVDFVNKLQNVNKEARFRLIKDLSAQGLTVKSLIKEEVKDGKTYVDNSNKEFIEKAYIEEVQSEAFNKIIKDMLGKDLQELALDIGLETEEEVNQFGEDIGKVLVGRFQGTNKEK